MKNRIQKGGVIVDLGNVIIAHWLSNINETNFETIDYNSIPEVPGCFDILKRLNEKFGGNITVVYKATNVATEKILAWLAHHQFAERTGISMDRVHRTNGGRDKTSHIDQSTSTRYGTTVMIDDRLEVLSHFVGKVPYLFLFQPRESEIEAFSYTGALAYCRIVKTWQEIENILNT